MRQLVKLLPSIQAVVPYPTENLTLGPLQSPLGLTLSPGHFPPIAKEIKGSPTGILPQDTRTLDPGLEPGIEMKAFCPAEVMPDKNLQVVVEVLKLPGFAHAHASGCPEIGKSQTGSQIHLHPDGLPEIRSLTGNKGMRDPDEAAVGFQADRQGLGALTRMKAGGTLAADLQMGLGSHPDFNLVLIPLQ